MEYLGYLIRDWQENDLEEIRFEGRAAASGVIRSVLQEYGLPWQPEEADRDVIAVETAYLALGGEFWVVEHQGKIVGTAAYYPIKRGNKAVEIRKMYILPQFRGQGLGKYLLQQLEIIIAAKGYQEIWIETASVLFEAVQLYENQGYQSTTGVETKRCDLIYVKRL